MENSKSTVSASLSMPSLSLWSVPDEILRSIRTDLPDIVPDDVIENLSPLSQMVLGAVVSPSSEMVDQLNDNSSALSAVYEAERDSETPLSDNPVVLRLAARFGHDAAGLVISLLRNSDRAGGAYLMSLLQLLTGVEREKGITVHRVDLDGTVVDTAIYAKGLTDKTDIVEALLDIGIPNDIRKTDSADAVVVPLRSSGVALISFKDGVIDSVTLPDGEAADAMGLVRVVGYQGHGALRFSLSGGEALTIWTRRGA